MILRVLIVVGFISIFTLYANAQKKVLPIIPYPQEVEFMEGAFLLTEVSGIVVDNADEELVRLGKVLNDKLGTELDFISLEKPKSIKLEINPNLKLKDEGYFLKVNQSEVKLTSNSHSGIFYGIQTLKQLADVDKQVIQSVEIKDEPRFKYRGLHLDVGRHFFDIESVKKFIDVMSFYKYNNFHWHLTEDQGWRIEIKKYPNLVEVGSTREGTLIGHLNERPHKYDNVAVSGYYTQEEVREIINYAKKRYINIIPEIEMPGHSSAALASYPHLGCVGKDYKVEKKWGIYSNIYCAGKESTFEFLEDVIDEVVELFPSEYIHIGGDEADKDKWEVCKHCRRRMNKEKFDDCDQLQSYFVKRMENYINSKGRKMIGWHEITKGGLESDATVMVWGGSKKAIDVVELGHDVIMTPISRCYFDLYQAEKETEPLAIGGNLYLEKVYNFDPIPKKLPADKQHHIVGAQANIWTEYIKTEDHLEYMAYPRACAMAETLWGKKIKQPFEEFKKRLTEHQVFLDEMDVNYFDK